MQGGHQVFPSWQHGVSRTWDLPRLDSVTAYVAPEMSTAFPGPQLLLM